MSDHPLDALQELPQSPSPGESPVRVVSVSLGSSSRNHVAEAELLGRKWILERRGTDGDLGKAQQLISELDGEVAAIGLGGIDLYVVAGGRKYVMRDAARLAAAAKITPVVDGSGLKDTLERSTVRRLQETGILPLRGRAVMLTCAVDRFGMAEELVSQGAKVRFGDLLFILNVPVMLNSLQSVRRLASVILPVATKLPFKMLYPTGEKQEAILEGKNYAKAFAAADIIAGDFLLIRRFLPKDLAGKSILTNTVTARDIELLRERGAERLVTTTPEFNGRSFGTNVMEGIFAALGATTPCEYEQLLTQLGWQPRVVDLQKA